MVFLLPDAAVYQKHHLVNIKPGERIPEATTPIIVMQKRKTVSGE